MELTLDPTTSPETSGGYTNAPHVAGASKLLFIRGQIPVSRDGEVASGIEAQCRQVWANLTATLTAAGMDVTNLVKVTSLGDRSHAAVNTAVRNEVLGSHRTALTVIITEIWGPSWLLEIEAVAADG